jgi:hypothetical protein
LRYGDDAQRFARNISCLCAHALLHLAKTLVFLSRCSNPNAVFAIPAGTVTTSPLTQARRAAWRRSEGRRRKQQRRARRRPSAGRRSNQAPLHSLDFNDSR